jgi:hypothetical protein
MPRASAAALACPVLLAPAGCGMRHATRESQGQPALGLAGVDPCAPARVDAESTGYVERPR